MNVVGWLWRELTRPRGHVRHRFYRGGRSSRAGVALLMVITSIMLLTILVTEISHGAGVRIRLAAQHRDEVKAEALAHTGVQLYRLILMASKAIGKNPMVQSYGEMLGINADSLWQMVPAINTQMMRLLLTSGGNLDEEDVAVAKVDGLSDEQREESREGSSLLNKNFLDFDGDFSAKIQDENRRIYVGSFKPAANLPELLQQASAQQILGMMNREEVRDYLFKMNLNKEELVANLADWTDVDDTRIYLGGSEESIYERLDHPYKPKNAPFDTRDEIRLVEGWHLDGVWERIGKDLTIYGDGKVNINTAHKSVIRGLLMAYTTGPASEAFIEPLLDNLMLLRGTPMAEGGVHFTNPGSFRKFVEGTIGIPLDPSIDKAVTTESQTFRIHSIGEVGNATVDMYVVIDFSRDPTGQILYHRIR